MHLCRKIWLTVSDIFILYCLRNNMLLSVFIMQIFSGEFFRSHQSKHDQEVLCSKWRIQFERRANCSLEWILNTKIFHKFENRRRNVSTWQVMSDLLWTLMWILFYLPTMMARSTPQSRMPSPTRNSLGESELAILIILWTNSSCSRWFSWTYSTTCQSCWSSSTSQTQETSQSVESIK